VRRYCQKFGQSFADRLCRRPRPGNTWYMDEVFIRIQGVQHYQDGMTTFIRAGTDWQPVYTARPGRRQAFNPGRGAGDRRDRSVVLALFGQVGRCRWSSLQLRAGTEPAMVTFTPERLTRNDLRTIV
jgi:hypothetical protein